MAEPIRPTAEVVVDFDADVARALERRARQEGCTVSELVERCLREHLASCAP